MNLKGIVTVVGMAACSAGAAPAPEPFTTAEERCIVPAANLHLVNPHVLRAILRVESGLNPKAINRNENGTYDIGLGQMNSMQLRRLSQYGISGSVGWVRCNLCRGLAPFRCDARTWQHLAATTAPRRTSTNAIRCYFAINKFASGFSRQDRPGTAAQERPGRRSRPYCRGRGTAGSSNGSSASSSSETPVAMLDRGAGKTKRASGPTPRGEFDATFAQVWNDPFPVSPWARNQQSDTAWLKSLTNTAFEIPSAEKPSPKIPKSILRRAAVSVPEQPDHVDLHPGQRRGAVAPSPLLSTQSVDDRSLAQDLRKQRALAALTSG